MLLVLTGNDDPTADYLIPILRQGGIECIRVDTVDLLTAARPCYRLSAPTLHVFEHLLTPDSVSHIWYRRPSPSHVARNAEERYALREKAEAIDGFFGHIDFSCWMNHPTANSLATRKLYQLTRAREIGLNVPSTLVSQSPEDLKKFYNQHNGSIICKPLSIGHIDSDDNASTSLIYTNVVTEIDMLDLSDLESCPTLFQERIDKDFDVRATVVDNSISAIKLVAKDCGGVQRLDIRRNQMDDVEYERITLPTSLSDQILQLMRQFKLRFGAIDLACAHDGTWYFFEINPNGQWAWLDFCGGQDIASYFVDSFGGSRNVHSS